jgi:hypothetical protein
MPDRRICYEVYGFDVMLDSAGGVLRTSTRSKLNLLLLLIASVCAFTLKESRAPSSLDRLFSTTLLLGAAAVAYRGQHRALPVGAQRA